MSTDDEVEPLPQGWEERQVKEGGREGGRDSVVALTLGWEWTSVLRGPRQPAHAME